MDDRMRTSNPTRKPKNRGPRPSPGDSAEFAVAIRSATVAQGPPTANATPTTSVTCQAGVGLVATSNVDAEWRELEVKAQQYMRLLTSPPWLDAS